MKRRGRGTDVTCNSAAIAGCRGVSLGRGVGWRRRTTTRRSQSPAPPPPRRGRIGRRRRRRRSGWWGCAPKPDSPSSPAHSAFVSSKIGFSSKRVAKTNNLCSAVPSHYNYNIYVWRLWAWLAGFAPALPMLEFFFIVIHMSSNFS